MKKILFTATLTVSIAIPVLSFGAGYELLEQSASGVGQAFSGSSTGYGDGSEVFFNPAAMADLTGESTASGSIHIIAPKAKFNSQGSQLAPQLGGAPLTGDDDDGAENAIIPNAYITHKINDALSLGLGLNSPFGLATEYDDNWVGRYHALRSELKTININPAISYKADDWISLGASLQVMHAEAELTNAVDLGTVGLSALGLPTASALGLLPQMADGHAKVEGNDIGVGFGLGAIMTPSKGTKIGISYRSKNDFTLEGDADFTVPTNALPLTQSGLFTDQDAKAEFTLPEILNFGVAHELDSETTLYADATWIKWDRFKELRIQFSGVQPDSVQAEEWENTWRFAIGAKHDFCKEWFLRTGYAFDETPISDDSLRTPRIPDNDRHWASVGFGYNLTESTVIGVNYAHLFVSDANTSALATSTGAILNGSWDLGVDILSLSVSGNF